MQKNQITATSVDNVNMVLSINIVSVAIKCKPATSVYNYHLNACASIILLVILFPISCL